jgi:tetratricopeptide (TPR) repeat protein
MKSRMLAIAAGLLCSCAIVPIATLPAAAKTTRLKMGIYIYTGNPATDKLLNSGQYDKAEQQSLAQLKKSPRNERALIGAGWAQAKMFKLDAADANFDKALAVNPHNAVADFGKAMVVVFRLQSSSNTQIKNKDALLRQAEAEARQGLSINPNFPEGHWTLGMVYKEQGRIDDAINEFRAASNADPNYADGYSGMGMAMLDKNDLTGATQAAKEALALNSRNSTAHYVQGEVYRREGRLDDALKELNVALYQNRNSAPVHLSIGRTLAQQGNTVGAVKEYQQSISIKPENPGAYLGIADIRESRGDLELSISELRSALEMDPNSAPLHQRVGDDSLRLEKLDDALKEYETVLNMQPNNAAAAESLTRAFYLKANKEATGAFMTSNDYESAKGMIDRAVAMNPNNMELRLAQIKIRAMSGETIDPRSVPPPTNNGERIAYAEACLALNKFQEADNQMKYVINSINTPKQLFAVADASLMIKDLPNAEQAYRKAMMMPGGAERAKRGLDQVAKQREVAKEDLTLAEDLAKHGQVKSAIDKYRSSIFQNPRVSDAHFNYATALEKDKPETSANYREAATQLTAYMSLEPTLPPKEVEKLQKKIAGLQEKAYKLQQKEGRR